MARLDLPAFQKHLSQFHLTPLFVDVLGWSRPPAAERVWADDTAGATRFARRALAELGGVMVLQVVVDDGWPDESARMRVWNHVAQRHAENLLIFTDGCDSPTQSLWYWVKRSRNEAGKPKLVPRRHEYFRGQPVDLFASKLQAMVVELSELDAAGRLPVLEAARRLQSALDVEAVTKRFYSRYADQHASLLSQIEGIADERDRRWYASVILNRLMFVWFLQKKLFLDGGDANYLPRQLEVSRQRGRDRFFGEFLNALFFEAFAKPEADRSADARALTGRIPYLNGGLFLHHKLELDEHHAPRLGKTLRIPDAAFDGVFKVFSNFSWHLDDKPGGQADEINPDVLGYIFEKYINQKAFGAYYTRPEITGYLAERSIHALILERVREPALPELKLPAVEFESVADLLARMDARTAMRLVEDVLPSITVLDPAVGSGAFLVAALKCLINVYYAIVGRAELGASRELKQWLAAIQRQHPSVGYYIKRRIVTDNLHGVDIMEEACEIAKLRLFLAMVSSVREVGHLEPLPNIDFNILPGNSLVGLMRVDEHAFDTKLQHQQLALFRKDYSTLLQEKRRALDAYRHAADAVGQAVDLRSVRDGIDSAMAEANAVMNELIQDQFAERGIKFEQATWDATKGELGKPKRRAVTLADVAAQHPLHWGYVFDEIVQQRGGFDIILANPPWEVFKPQAKEFFADHSELVTKNNMTIKEFEKEQARLLKSKSVRDAWLDYESRFPHMSAWFRSAPEYQHQSAVVNGKKTGSDINLYKLFLERCFHLLRDGGHCGIVIPSGVYKDLGATGLRKMLFDRTRVDSLVSLSNEKFIFDEVHHSFGIAFLSLTKGGKTECFRAAFRINPREAISADAFESFVHDESNFVQFTREVVCATSPETLSVLEFRSDLDLFIVTKMLRFPMLGETVAGSWNLRLTNEFHMTIDSKLFKPADAQGRWPLWEGKQFHQFDANYAAPRYWLDPVESKSKLRDARLRAIARELKTRKLDLQVDPDAIQLDCDSYRLAFRDIARTTDARTMIAAVLPPGRFCPHTVSLESVYEDKIDGSGYKSVARLDAQQRLYLLGLFNSLVFDWVIRQTVTTHVSFFIVYGVHAPRPDAEDTKLRAIAQRAARLTCTLAEFDSLGRAIGLRDHGDAAVDPVDRARLRAEIDGLVAHLYGLTDEEFLHILSTFPLVPEPEKVAAYNAYRDVARGLIT